MKPKATKTLRCVGGPLDDELMPAPERPDQFLAVTHDSGRAADKYRVRELKVGDSKMLAWVHTKLSAKRAIEHLIAVQKVKAVKRARRLAGI